jgi:hypothetical protein
MAIAFLQRVTKEWFFEHRVNVKVTIFGDFLQYSETKLAFFFESSALHFSFFPIILFGPAHHLISA